MDKPSNIALDNEFNTTDEDAIIKKILRDGTIQVRKVRHHPHSSSFSTVSNTSTQNPERQGDTNMTMGSQGNH